MPFSNFRNLKQIPINNGAFEYGRLTIRAELCAYADVLKSTNALRGKTINRDAVGRIYSLFPFGKKRLS